MEFRDKVCCNTSDILLAIREGMRPMQTFFDKTKNGLPFFWNQMSPMDGFGNSHHPTFSAAHIPGRWLLGLLHAEEVLGIEVDKEVIANLRKWAFAPLTEVRIGFPACMNEDYTCFEKVTDLHNLREVMHALFALTKWRNDSEARRLGLGLIRAVDKYFDYENGRFDEERYSKETGAEIAYSCATKEEGLLFPPHFGRYLGAVVKFWKETGEGEALAQAKALKDVCFKHVLLDDGDYDSVRFGGHTHSTTAMMSSLAQLGEATDDSEIFERIVKFFNNGLSKIALPFGWCIENDSRNDNLVGEINNTSDIMETCLILGKRGYEGYYAKAEQILRSHFLPSQLLDTSFIPECEDESKEGQYRMASRAKGAFGFPTPFGHEDSKGAWISFNWDIVGGGVNGLCEAYKEIAYVKDGVTVVPMHFALDNQLVSITDPYTSNGVMTITPKTETKHIKLRIPHRAKVKSVSTNFTVDGEWLNLTADKTVVVEFEFETVDISYNFRGANIVLRWRGESVIGANNKDRRLCFFDSIEK